MRTATISIDANALAHNIEKVAKLASNSQIMVMLKANAYGHGIDTCTLSLLDNTHVQAIGVATMEEALQVRTLGWNKKIVLIEGVFSNTEWETAIQHGLQCIVHHQQQLDWALQTIPTINSPTRTIWLKYNTGMNRLGFSCEAITPTAIQLDNVGYQQILTSHFANADDKHHPLNQIQQQKFSKQLTKLTALIPTIQASLCNSAGIVNFSDYHYQWVRAGIMIYGSSPVNNKTAKQLDLQPVMTFSAKIMAIHNIEAGEMVGYGSRWTANKTSCIGIVSVGYGDGYPRVIDEHTYVEIITPFASFTCPIIGRVAMDMIVVDLTDTNNQATIDNDVILWGKNPHIDAIAKSAHTIGYELLCRLTTRPNRISQ